MGKLLDTVRAARRVSTPLLAVETADQVACVASLMPALNGGSPVVCHDIVRGFTPVNDAGQEVMGGLGGAPDEFASPVAATVAAEKFPAGTVLLMLNAHRTIREDPGFAQGVAILRDAFKANRRTLVLMGPQVKLPLELQSDVVVLSEELPDDDRLRSICFDLHEAADLPMPSEETSDLVVDTVRGLSAFSAEQVIALSLRKEGVDLESCWERKKAAINQTPGLSIAKHAVTFDQVGGMAQAVKYARMLFAGPRAPRAIVRVEEMEKMVAGAGFGGGPGDSSGTSSYQIGKLLTSFEEKNWSGMIAVGPAGSGKSLYAMAMGGTFNRPTIDMDLGAMKASLVGDTEANTNHALRVLEAIGGDRVFFIATCNRLESLPPELRRRFRSGIWYFDIPTAEERRLIWDIQTRRFGLVGELPDDEDWTGAEIRNCCEQASALQCTLKDASEFVIPMMRSQPAVVDKLRSMANGTFFDASRPGVYEYRKTEKVTVTKTEDARRKIELPDGR